MPAHRLCLPKTPSVVGHFCETLRTCTLTTRRASTGCKCGLMMSDLVFCTRKGRVLGRRNLLRHIKVGANQLGLSKAVDFRSFRTMNSSLMLRGGARPEVVRDNMGHANIDVIQNVYGESWWEERVDAVTRAVEAVKNAAQNAEEEAKQNRRESVSNEWVPLGAPAGS